MEEKDGILKIKDLELIKNEENILNGISLQVNPGEVCALVGPNGAGKSSLAYTAMGLKGYEAVNGSIYFDGEDITDLSIYQRARKGITLAWQEPARFEGVTVRKFLSLGVESQGRKVTGKKLKKALQKVAINPRYLERKVDETLSGGERKKIELASIILMEPKLVILDEPDSGIDVSALNNISEVIADFKKEGIGVLLITHSEEILRLADKAILICKGEVVRRGVPRRLRDYFEDDCLPCEDEKCLAEVK
jgi:Fe-S cluster assembly ATP-binding protein